ncbi:CMP-sialic acid transporter isoform X4 [Leptonychotes weddellii]|uniref:CMP-sialic acid transporter isoform X4 n=1 Tax=Leptonychotes weddellii TaxID=9713 RepID=A0A7F8PVA6_LEPWE|nr:CMP-sialic acid transporter isoform X4 [Leptonychotes weddellii]
MTTRRRSRVSRGRRAEGACVSSARGCRGTMAAPRENVSLLFKLYCLAVMTLVAAAYTIALRYTRTSDRELYFSTTAVCITEVIKLLLSVGILAKETGSPGRFKASLRENVLGSPKELMKLSVPSLVYAVQNNMAFLALSNLDAAVYQVTYQLKIPCTALCTVLMLNRTLSKLQWISVFMLCGGVILVQWEPAQATKVVVEQNPLLGFGAVAIAVLCSGFAVLASVGGLYTSVVVKYTDNIMKGFSAAAAIVLSTIASVMLFGLQIKTEKLKLVDTDCGAIQREAGHKLLLDGRSQIQQIHWKVETATSKLPIAFLVQQFEDEKKENVMQVITTDVNEGPERHSIMPVEGRAVCVLLVLEPWVWPLGSSSVHYMMKLDSGNGNEYILQ